MNYTTIGQQIRNTRIDKRLTIEQLAESSGISPNFLGKIERGQSVMSLETFVKIATALDCSPDTLLQIQNSSHSSNSSKERRTLEATIEILKEILEKID